MKRTEIFAQVVDKACGCGCGSTEPDGTWRATDGAGVMFRGLDSEERVWLMANP